MLLFALLLVACVEDNTQETLATNTEEIAIQKIANYADDASALAPTVEDYEAAGVTGVNADNLEAINAKVLTLVYEDVDTQEEIQALMDDSI